MDSLEPYAPFLGWVIFGLIAGVLAKLLMPGRDPGGLVITAALGIGGAFLGNYIYAVSTGERLGAANQFTLSGLFMAVMGGFVLLFCFRVLFGRTRSSY